MFFSNSLGLNNSEFALHLLNAHWINCYGGGAITTKFELDKRLFNFHKCCEEDENLDLISQSKE